MDGTTWRFRVNVLTQLGNIGLVARRISNSIPDFEGLYLPPAVEQLCNFDQGLVLLAGVTGPGKSTTIAAMLNYINHKYRKHILTLEDPIAFNARGIVAQKLVKSIKPGVGRVPVAEIMFFGPTVQKLILEGEDHKLPDAGVKGRVVLRG